MKYLEDEVTRGMTRSGESSMPGAGYFHHHGVWAVGVRLFRRMRFRAKAWSISLAFGIPLLILLLGFLRHQQQQLDFVRHEREGVQVMLQLQELLQGLLEARNSARAMLGGHDVAAAHTQARGRVDSALRSLSSRLRQEGDVLHIAEQVNRLTTAWEATARAPKGVDGSGRTVFGPVSDATVKLLQLVGDNAMLVLDPELDSFYLVNAAVLTLPRTSEDLGQLWGWSTYGVAKDGLDLAQYRRYAVWDASAQRGLDELEQYLARARAANPALALESIDQGLQHLRQYRHQLSDPAVMISQSMTPDEVWGQGLRAMATCQSVSLATLSALDGLLEVREQRLVRLRMALITLTVVCLGLAAYLFFAFYLVMDGGLREVARHLKAMRDGDLTTRPVPWGNDEAASLMLNLCEVQQALSVLVASMRESARAMVQTSTTMAHGARELSARTDQSADQLQQSSAAMVQISSSAAQTADYTQRVADMARSNAEVVQQGSTQVQGMMVTMDGIAQASQHMKDITGLIDSIAFRTNILALNAAVEAARAGNEGRGFAVVATEVRALAQRSAQAARDIRGLIAVNLDRVTQGNREVSAAETTMGEVERSARDIDQLLADIALAVREQREGVSMVDDSVRCVDQLTQQNAQLVQESAIAAAELERQAHQLARDVARFRLPPPMRLG